MAIDFPPPSQKAAAFYQSGYRILFPAERSHAMSGHYVWWIGVFAGVYLFRKHWRPWNHSWAFGRSYYLSFVALGVSVCALNAMRVWVHAPLLKTWGTPLLGIMLIAVATVPCSIRYFNSPWYRRRLRDAFFVGLGLFTLFTRFPDRWS